MKYFLSLKSKKEEMDNSVMESMVKIGKKLVLLDVQTSLQREVESGVVIPEVVFDIIKNIYSKINEPNTTTEVK